MIKTVIHIFKNFIIFSGFIVSTLIISSCELQKDEYSGIGFLKGKVTIGPLCPTQSEIKDPSCQASKETYEAWQINVWNLHTNKFVSEIKPNPNGTYHLNLYEGSFKVDLAKQQRIGTNNLPSNITIHAGKTTTLNIDIDTGIR